MDISDKLQEWKERWETGDSKFVSELLEEADRMHTALFNIAITGVLNENYAPEVLEALEGCKDCARWGLGWKK